MTVIWLLTSKDNQTVRGTMAKNDQKVVQINASKSLSNFKLP
jgi:hypothetical protein